MVVLAKSVDGQEFMYSPRSAHKVPASRAAAIRDALNGIRYDLNDGQVWHLHEIDKYDAAYDFAEMQKFHINKSGALVERRAN